MTRRPKRLFSSRPPDEEIDDELRFHIAGAVEELVASGVGEEAARQQVLKEFGDLGRIREECRQIALERVGRERKEEVMGSIARDIRVAFRRLRRQPAFTGAAVLTLTLGIGASVAMFSVVEGVVLRPLPYPGPQRLVSVWPAANFNIAMVDRFRDAPSLGSVTGLSRWAFTLTGEGEPERLDGIAVDPDYFEVFGVHPAHGRAFAPEERAYDRAAVVLLGWDFWQRRFGGDPDVVGRRILVDGHREKERLVVGVMPSGHQPPGRPADLWVPLATDPAYTVAQDSSWYVNDVVARLVPGATVGQARTEVRELAQRLRAEFPGRFTEEYVLGADATGLLDDMVGDVRRGLWVMLGAVGLVLIIACANVANLLLARTAEQGRDLALRSALGAGRGRLVRQALLESLVLALIGGALGVGLAWWSLGLIESGVQLALPRGAEISLSLPVLVFAVTVTVASVFVFGLLPALRGARGEIASELKSGGRRHSGGPGQQRLRRVLVASEVALAVVLAAGAGLLLRSFGQLYGTDPGFRPDDVLAIEVARPGAELADERAELAAYYHEVQDRLAAVPGVARVGAIHLLPLTGGNWSFPYLAEGHEPGLDGNLESANFRIVTPGYFQTMGIPLLQGRDFAEADVADALGVGLVNQAMAEELWPGEDPVGKEILLFGSQPFRVVGVVGNVRQFTLDRAPLPEMYRPLNQFSAGSLYMLVRGQSGDVASLALRLRQVIWEVDPDVPIPFVGTVDGVVADSVARARFFAAVLAGFGILALALGAVGVYGVTAFTVASRLPEYGVRIALGAAPESMVRRAVSRGLRPVLWGIVVGLSGALMAGRLLSSLLYEISPTDPLTLLSVAGVLCGVAVMAILLPARRASRVDPVDVLRAE
jgi:predicted permease